MSRVSAASCLPVSPGGCVGSAGADLCIRRDEAYPSVVDNALFAFAQALPKFLGLGKGVVAVADHHEPVVASPGAIRLQDTDVPCGYSIDFSSRFGNGDQFIPKLDELDGIPVKPTDSCEWWRRFNIFLAIWDDLRPPNPLSRREVRR